MAAEPYIGEVRIFAFDRVPNGWLPCKGQMLPIATHGALYSILGTTYGGDGRSTFSLPDLQGRVPIHPGTNISLGQAGGEEKHRLTIEEMPVHSHRAVAGSDAPSTATSPKGKTWGTSFVNSYSSIKDGLMKASALGESGASQPHNNMQPYIVYQYCIAIAGYYPPRP
ncbi:phage tail protein [Cohnella thailandensis]|uniref:Phage tail protein n=1 Tax=Cohnella thailandensis TaxID=557557 RepID=A0A841SYL5_9BACL|nr:tail fiber protein [Cohnella thailandensis]MBB6634697.1 phage tail protein [Cohnella thailandensis]MBP1972747.1 microcystin-dependent protein [Cohnella thailandensis]